MKTALIEHVQHREILKTQLEIKYTNTSKNDQNIQNLHKFNVLNSMYNIKDIDEEQDRLYR